MKNSDTFVKITNKDIYDKLEHFIENNKKEHEQILIKQSQTNGRVKLNRWISSTAISLIFIVMGWLVKSGVQ